MLRLIFNVLFKVLLALGAVFAALSLLRYFETQKTDYIEIYNEDGLDGEYC